MGDNRRSPRGGGAGAASNAAAAPSPLAQTPAKRAPLDAGEAKEKENALGATPNSVRIFIIFPIFSVFAAELLLFYLHPPILRAHPNALLTHPTATRRRKNRPPHASLRRPNGWHASITLLVDTRPSSPRRDSISHTNPRQNPLPQKYESRLRS
jgi:hypothetical protein